jgi:hypothetical protein
MKKFYFKTETECSQTFVQLNGKLMSLFFPGLSFSVMKNTLFLFFFILFSLNMTGQNPGINLELGANGAWDSSVSPVEWIRGNVNAQKAHLLENYAVPYRIIKEQMPVGQSVTVEIGCDTKHDDRKALL